MIQVPATAIVQRIVVVPSITLLCGVALLAQGTPATTTAPATAASRTSASSRSGSASAQVDNVIALVKGGMSEAMVIKTLKREGKTVTLSTADLLKLQKAGVSEAIIDAMSGEGAGAGANDDSAPAARAGGGPSVGGSGSAGSGASASFPPDLSDAGATPHKRRLAIEPFDYSTVKTWVNYWFNSDQNIGEGIRSMLSVRLQGSKYFTMVERKKLANIMKEQDTSNSNRFKKGTQAKIGQLSGADAVLYGDIVIFGRDDTTKRKSLSAIITRFSPVAGAVASMDREEKAVVGINLRLVDAETGEQIDAAEARGESSRKSRDYAGALGVKGAAASGSTGMTSSNFEQTIIGEATSNAVLEIVHILEGKLPQMSARPRQIEGRVASVTGGGAYLSVGSEDGVARGDRFEILKINGEIRDPVTKDIIDIDAIKIGEMVIDEVRDRTAVGHYGGQPLSSNYVTGKGYAARLVQR
jgi:curli biogenesis system outer membrane secretion channel CsgG